MPSVQTLLGALEEKTIAQRIGIPHDEARIRYPLRSNTVGSFSEFSDVIGDYYNYHFTQCVSRGGALSRTEAASRAKEILEKEYRRHNGDIVSAFTDAHDGTHGGMRVVVDILAEGLKAESIEHYIHEVFDQQVAPNSWEDKVDIIRQFIAQCGMNLSSSIRAHQPERYAQNYVELIRSYVNALKQTSSIFRRL
jgi:predicted metallopeptidase